MTIPGRNFALCRRPTNGRLLRPNPASKRHRRRLHRVRPIVARRRRRYGKTTIGG